MKRLCSILVFSLVTALLGCEPPSSNNGAISRPSEAHIDLSDDTLNKYDADSRKALFRYLSGNARWEICEEQGIKYAIRREKIEGNYKTTLHGFYYTNDGAAGAVQQTRVILSFDKPYGFGRDHGNITRTKVGDRDVAVIIEGPHASTPGNTSYVIVEGAGLFLEIYDQSPQVQRAFTASAFSEVCSELTDVLKHIDEINSTGVLPIDSRYPDGHPTEGRFDVNDGNQPGIYLLSAAVNPTAAGYVYTKVFDATTGKPLSADRIVPRSRRYVGWSKGGQKYFPYNAEITVYGGDWSTKYNARFELWHHMEDGAETKLAESTRMINGWQR